MRQIFINHLTHTHIHFGINYVQFLVIFVSESLSFWCININFCYSRVTYGKFANFFFEEFLLCFYFNWMSECSLGGELYCVCITFLLFYLIFFLWMFMKCVRWWNFKRKFFDWFCHKNIFTIGLRRKILMEFNIIQEKIMRFCNLILENFA